MFGGKECVTPMSTTTPLLLNDGSNFANGTLYRQLMGSLQYLLLTRLDISHVVNNLSQFMHKPY